MGMGRIRVVCVVILLLCHQEMSRGEVLRDVRSAGLQHIDISSQDSSGKSNSFKSVLSDIFPEIEVDSLRMVNDRLTENGAMMQFNQYIYGLKVLFSNAWVKTNKDGGATYAGVTWYDNTNLGYKSILADKDDQTTLRALAHTFCDHCDSISYVSPGIMPFHDSLGTDTLFKYVLIIYSPDEPSGIVYNWESGDSLTCLGEWNVNIYIDANVLKKDRDETGEASSVRLAHAGFEIETNWWVGTEWIFRDTLTNGNGYNRIEAQIGDTNHYWWGYEANYNAFDLFMYHSPSGVAYGWYENDWDPPVSNQHYVITHPNEGMGTTCYFLDLAQDQIGGPPIWATSESSTNYGARTIFYEEGDNNFRPRVYFDQKNQRFYDQYRDVITHEYGHALQLQAYGEFGIPYLNPYGGVPLAEGLANFFAAHIGATVDPVNANELLRLPGTTGPVDYDITVPWSYFDYVQQPLADQPNLVSSALWSLRELVSANYGSGGLSELEDAFVMAHFEQAIDLSSWTAALARALDENDTLCDGWRFGEEMYAAFWDTHRIPCNNGWLAANDFWQYYRLQPIPGDITSESIEAFGPSATANIVKGQFGLYSVYKDSGDDVSLAWSIDEGQSWRIRKLEGTPSFVSAPEQTFPSIAIQSETNLDYLLICSIRHAFDGAPKYQKYLISVTGDQNCDLNVEYSQVRAIGGFLDADDEVSAPACVFAGGYATIFYAPSTPGESLGSIHYTRFDPSNPSEGIGGGVEGTSHGVVSSVAAFTHEDTDTVHVAWISGDTVFYRWGKEGNDGAFQWPGSIVQLSNDGVTGKANISVAYSPSLRGVFVAWDGVDPGTGKKQVYYRKGHWSATDPGFEALQSLSHSSYDYHSPVLHPYSLNYSALPSNTPRVALAYVSSNIDVSNIVNFTSLWINEGSPTIDSLWRWLSPLHVVGSGGDRTASPSLYTADANGGYALLTISTGGSSPYPIKFWRAERPYVLTQKIVWPDIHISSNDTIRPPFNYGGSIVVDAGGELVITKTSGATGADATFALWDTCGITVAAGGRLKILGEAGKPIVLSAVDTISQMWNGIKISGKLDMQYAEMKDCEAVCIYSETPEDILIDHCLLDGSKMVNQAPLLRLWNAPGILQRVYNTTVENGSVGLYLMNCYVDFQNDTVRNCSYVNSLISKTSGHIDKCYFEGHPSNYSVLFYSATCNPNITCCTFKDLAANAGTYLATVNVGTNCSPTFAGNYGQEAYPEISNVFNDTSTYLMKIMGGTPRPTFVINDWIQNSGSGKFIYWNSPTTNPPFDIEDQYWNSAPTATKFYPQNASNWDWTPCAVDEWLLCSDNEPGGGSVIAPRPGEVARSKGSLDDEPTDEYLLDQAMRMEANGEFEDAREAYRDLVFSTSGNNVRWHAMVGCVTTDVHCEIPADWINAYIDSLEIVENGGYRVHIDRTRLLYNYYVNLEQFDEAVTECTTLLNSGLEYIDSLTIAVDLISIQMASGVISGYGLDSENGSDVPQPLRVSSAAQGMTLSYELLDAIGRASEGAGGELQVQELLPTEYRLYQNYPNPFNPTTQIEFDLPEAARVSLKVFNTLGQEVATVNDALYVAGHHVATWNGKSNAGNDVATGLYIYQINAGSFTDTKKMVLMR